VPRCRVTGGSCRRRDIETTAGVHSVLAQSGMTQPPAEALVVVRVASQASSRPSQSTRERSAAVELLRISWNASAMAAMPPAILVEQAGCPARAACVLSGLDRIRRAKSILAADG
jgi:hypothetical protein